MLRLQASLQTFVALADLVQMLAHAALEPHFQVVQALGLLGQAFAGVTQASAQVVEAQMLAGEAVAQALPELPVGALDLLQHGLLVGAEQFGCGRGRRGAHVGNEVADRNVGLVTYGAHGRGLAGGEGAGDDFFIERPEIFQ